MISLHLNVPVLILLSCLIFIVHWQGILYGFAQNDIAIPFHQILDAYPSHASPHPVLFEYICMFLAILLMLYFMTMLLSSSQLSFYSRYQQLEPSSVNLLTLWFLFDLVFLGCILSIHALPFYDPSLGILAIQSSHNDTSEFTIGPDELTDWLMSTVSGDDVQDAPWMGGFFVLHWIRYVIVIFVRCWWLLTGQIYKEVQRVQLDMNDGKLCQISLVHFIWSMWLPFMTVFSWYCTVTFLEWGTVPAVGVLFLMIYQYYIQFYLVYFDEYGVVMFILCLLIIALSNPIFGIPIITIACVCVMDYRIRMK